MDNFQPVQDIMMRIREISKIPEQFDQNEPVSLNEVAKNSEFLSELKKNIQEPQEKKSDIDSTQEKINTPEPIQNHTSSRSVLPKKQLGISAIIQKESQNKGVDPDLVKAIIKAESNFNPKAVSPKGALGLMQLMPETAEDLGVENPLNPVENIKGGVSYIKELSRLFKKRDNVIAAYNAGPGAVKKYGGVPPYSETKNYVRKVNEYFKDYKD